MKTLLLFLFSLINVLSIYAKTNPAITAETRLAYYSIDFGEDMPDIHAFALALQGYEKLVLTGKIKNPKLSIIDFNRSANEKRLWVIDMEKKELIYRTLVAHGRNSGQEFAQSFSNSSGSFQSSLGFYLTAYTYNGKHGNSLKLYGLEENINDAAFDRGIVIHGADYVSEQFIKNHGRLGRSLGCPAVPQNICNKLVSSIQNGSCLFIYKNNDDYLTASDWVK